MANVQNQQGINFFFPHCICSTKCDQTNENNCGFASYLICKLLDLEFYSDLFKLIVVRDREYESPVVCAASLSFISLSSFKNTTHVITSLKKNVY